MTMQETVQQFMDEIMECHLRKLRAEDEKSQESRTEKTVSHRKANGLQHRVQLYVPYYHL